MDAPVGHGLVWRMGAEVWRNGTGSFWEMNQLGMLVEQYRRRRGHTEVGRRGMILFPEMHQVGTPVGNGRRQCGHAVIERFDMAPIGRFTNLVRRMSTTGGRVGVSIKGGMSWSLTGR